MAPLVHLPYPKIPVNGGASAPAWVALEKIHGANFVIGVSAHEERFGKRKAWLHDDDAFFGWQLLRTELRAVARRVYERIAAGQRDARVYLYGELFGGAYPHASVAAVPGVSAVQTGVWYAPDLRWSPFDIRTVCASGADSQDRVDKADEIDEYLSFSEVAAIARDERLVMPPVIARGPRSEVDRAPVRYPSRVSVELGLPEIAGNVAEGFVKKPDVRMSAGRLTLFKEKIPEMSEKGFDGAEAFDSAQVLAPGALAVWAEKLVNRARIDSAASKVGRASDAIVIEVILDVLVDLTETFPAAAAALDAHAQASLEDTIARAARALLS